MKRILAFLDPWAHRHDVGYQVAESLMSIGSGGATGLGLGDGRQKLFFLPEAHTDFIFAIIGEELGLIGVTLLVVLYAIIIWRGVRVALAAPETFGSYLALGITSHHRLPGHREHVRGHGPAAHQGADAALHLLRRHLADRPDGGGRGPAVDQRRRPHGAPAAGLCAPAREHAGGRRVKVLIAGGGTGGHLFPGIALAEEVTTRHHANEVLFVGTERGLEARVVPPAGYKLERIRRRASRAWASWQLLKALLAAAAGLPRVLAHPARHSRTWWWAWAATPAGRWCSRPG